MELSISSYSFDKLIQTGKIDLVGCIAKAHEIGFCGIEFTSLPGETLAEQKKLALTLHDAAAKENMKICAYSVGAALCADTDLAEKAEVERLKEQAHVAAALGAPVMRHDAAFAIPKRYHCFDLALPSMAQNIREVAAYAEHMGIRTCSENHGHIVQESERCERLFCAVNHNNYGWLVDVGNFMCADEQSVLAVARLAPLAIHVHAKDMQIIPFGTKAPSGCFKTRALNSLQPCIVGDGNANVFQCLSILKSAGYDGFVSLEYEGAVNGFNELERSFNVLSEYLKRI